jgi:acetylornithine deacetylase/succinyl-diaminopimelate desuccinylase-like protein
MTLDLIETVCELVRLPSVNPMGREVQGEEYYEHHVTDYLQGVFERLGLPWQRQTVASRRDNIVARLDGAVPPEQGGPLLLLEAHQDTVPVDGMTIPPWTPEVRQGRVYGRGACDIKGGLACILTAIARLADERPPRLPTIVIACAVNEEFGGGGAPQLAELWQPGAATLLPRAPDAAIVAEPTQLNVVVAHKGIVRWRCHTTGRAAHSSQPNEGDNAIYRMAGVVSALERYARDVVPQLAAHPLVGRPSLSVGMIQGGISVNTVPDRCTIEIDRRLVPGEDPAEAHRHAATTAADPAIVHEPPYIVMPALADVGNGPLAARLSETARRCGAPGQCLGVPYGTDAPAFAAHGIPTVVFGPGSLAQAHTADEWVAVEQLDAAAEILYQFCRQADSS